MTCAQRWVGLSLLTVLLWRPGVAAGQQLFRLEQITGQIGFGFDGLWTASTVLPESGDRTYEEWAQARFAGSLLGPRIAVFDVGLNPVWRQRQLSRIPGAGSSGRGNRLNFIANVNALSDAPVRVMLNGSRFSGTELDPFGVKREGTEALFAAIASYPNPYFKLTRFSFERRALDAMRRQFGTIAPEQDVSQGTLQLTAENSKTRILLERIAIDDRLLGRDLTTSQALLSHRLHWGKGSRLQSFFNYLDRDRVSSVNWSQWTHLQHTYLLSSDYGYQLLTERGSAAANHSWRWDAAGRYRPAARLNLGIEGSGRTNNFDVSKEQWYEARAHVDVSASLPFGAEFRAGGSIGNTWFHRTTSAIRLLTVLGERHIVDNSRRFALDNLFTDPGTIAISNRARSILFDIGFDYSLIPNGAEVEVLILPAGRIGVGDTLFVDYSFQANPGGNDDFRTVTLGGSLRLRAVTVSHQQTARRNADGDSAGPDLTLAVRDESRTTLDVNLRTAVGYLSLSGQRLRTDNAFVNATDYVLHGGFDFAVRAGVSGGLFFDSTVREDEINPFEVMSGTAALRWAWNRSLQLNGRAGAWTLSRRDGPRQRSLTGGVGADCMFRSVTLRVRYDHLAFSEKIDRTENSLNFDIVRRF